MLMPIVRPDGIASTSRPQNLPLEEQSFEQMLSDFKQLQTTSVESSSLAPLDAQQQEDALPQPAQMLSQLGGLDRIENTTLRDMLTRNASGSDSTRV
jgi:hypothetical protein